jgi:hypothetical protein
VLTLYVGYRSRPVYLWQTCQNLIEIRYDVSTNLNIITYTGYVWLIITVLDRMIGFIDPSLYHLSLTYKPYSTIAELHTFQFTVVHALWFSIYTSHILATDLNTETITSNHYEVFLPFPAAANSEDSTQFSSGWTLHGNSTTSSPIQSSTQSQSQSQSYFMTGGLPPISSWCQAPETHGQQYFFFNWTLAVIDLM